ncbi:MAG TPA: hypothetical protein VF316_11435 [Polyangiaceae bacterium]
MRPLLFLGILAATTTGCVELTYFPDPATGTKVQATVTSREPGPVLYQRTGTRLVTNPTSLVSHRRRTYAVYAPLCAAPCSIEIDPGSPLYVSGDGITPSPLFKLDPKEGAVSVDVKPGPWAQSVLGLSGVFGGWAAFGVGSFLAFGGALSGQRDWIVPGVVTLGAGVGAMIVGAILLATGSTNVRVSPRTTGALTPGTIPW